MQKNNSSQYAIMLCVVIILFQTCLTEVFAQSDEKQILKIREVSNEALKTYENELFLSFLTEDVLITTGNGTLIAGKESLRKYIADTGKSKKYWIRTPDEVKINEVKGLAWETGIWKAYDPEQGDTPVTGGKYSAMWTKQSGVWQIKSQLFVSLE